MAAGVLVGSFPLMAEAYGRYCQRGAMREFEREVRRTPGQGESTGEVGGKIPFRLTIPKIRMDVVVKEGESGKSLAAGPVHYPKTALPGEEGNCVVSGHRTGYGSPFHWLDKMEVGDGIAVETGEGRNWYVVTEAKVISPSELEGVISGATDSTSSRSRACRGTDTRLTLVTCTPLFVNRERLVVVAKPGDPPPERRVWAGVMEPERRRGAKGEGSEGLRIPYLEWVRQLAKENRRPPELDPANSSGVASGRSFGYGAGSGY